jgi:hypothetical protein
MSDCTWKDDKAALRQEVRKKGEKDDIESSYRKPFGESLAGRARAERSDQPPEASLATGVAMLTVKRRQRVRMPCY